MHQKLKIATTLFSAALVFLLCVGLSCGVGTKTAFADSQMISFACEDGTTDVAQSTDANNHQVIAKCTSGALMNYTNYQSSGLQPVTATVNCPGSDSVASAVDEINQPTSKYVFSCVITSGGTSNPISKPTTDTPKVGVSVSIAGTCPDGSSTPDSNGNCPVSGGADQALNSGNCSDINKCDLINKYLNPFINFLAALVGVAVVASIVIGGIQYGSSAGDPSKVTAAKNRIRNAIIALVTFLILYALLDFLIPGGLF